MGLRRLAPDILKQTLTNALGWKTRRKIVVIESDDWGSIRMPSQATYDALSAQGLAIDDSYNRFDSLETPDDLTALYDVLSSFQDKKGNHPIITANYLVANPDFGRIKNDFYSQYYYETIIETYRKTSGCLESFRVLKEGMSAELIRPQYHGREHLNFSVWLEALRSGDEDTLLAFEHGTWGHVTEDANVKGGHFLAAFNSNNQKQQDDAVHGAVEGLRIFEDIFGYRPKTFIAPNYVWPVAIEKALADEGVSLLQGQRNQLLPEFSQQRCRARFHYSGQKNRFGQRYLVRNAFFEPSFDQSKNWVGSCLNDIKSAFMLRTPAVVCTHRVNFMGTLSSENRARNLAQFRSLLSAVVSHWPDVVFMSSEQLGDLMGSFDD